MHHSKIQVEYCFILQNSQFAKTFQTLNFNWNPRKSQMCQTHRTTLGYRTENVYTGRGGHCTYFLNRGPIKIDGLRVVGGWVVSGWVGGFVRIRPRCGSILQAGTCQIFSLAESPRFSRVWQQSK